MKFLRSMIGRLIRVVTITAWMVFGLWITGAAFFTTPVPMVVSSLLAIAILSIFFLAATERFHFYKWFGLPWRRKRFTALALVISAIVLIGYFGFMSPNNNQDWDVAQARMPMVHVEGNIVKVHDVRDFNWQDDSEHMVHYRDESYDVNEINSMYYVLCPLAGFDGVAHVFVSFGFSDGKHVSISVEGRRTKERPYRVIASLFRSYQLIYVVGEERDVVGLRGAVWKVPVYFYPVRTSPERMRAIFVSMMQRAHDLQEHPEYYNLITNNCLNNITAHLRRLGRSTPANFELLLTGYSDRTAYGLGLIDTELPFADAKKAFRVDPWMTHATLDEQFSQHLRQILIQQVQAVGGHTDVVH